MPKFDGYLFSRLTAIGSKSEGPLYFLQQFDYEEYQVIKKAPLWKNDPKLHKYLNRKVSITGDMSFSGIDYKSIALYKPGGKLAAANTLQIDLKLQHNPLWIDKQPGPKKGMRSTTFTLLVKWPYRSIWEGQCPTTQLYDFFVEYKGKKIWAWSDGQVFANVVTPVRLPGGKSYEFEGVWQIDPKTVKVEGAYTVRAVFIASGQEVKKSLKIKFAH